MMSTKDTLANATPHENNLVNGKIGPPASFNLHGRQAVPQKFGNKFRNGSMAVKS